MAVSLAAAQDCSCLKFLDSISIPLSPLPAYVGTNYAPGTHERIHIKTTLLDVHLQLSRLDEALAQINAARDRIRRKQHTLQEYSAQYTALISPVRRVPPEILAEIFLYFLPHPVYDYADTAVVRRNRMLPSHICKRWRDLSLSTPNFWANIRVDVDSGGIEGKLECAKAWLSRSGSCLLTIQISCISVLYPEAWNLLLAIVLPHCRRWRHVDINSSAPTDLSPIKHNLPMLESMNMTFREWPLNAPFEDIPKLRNIGVPASEALANGSLPWTQLTHFNIFFGSVQNCLGIIQKLPNLISLTVQICPPTDIVEPPHYRLLRLEHLTSLIVTAEHDITGFYEHLDLPALTNYIYEEEIGVSRWGMPPFLSLVSRSSCRLESLAMSLASAIGKDDMTLLLLHVPHLKYLELNCNPPSGTNSNNIQTLITLSSTCSLVPGLEQIVFDYDKDFNFQLLVTMIESRCQVIRAIEIGNIDLVTYKKLDPQVSMIGPLEALELAHGLDIWIAEVDSEGQIPGTMIYE